MKRSKDELSGNQLFPRLNVNDADKRGPRAPPRNKMALYEQLSIPSLKMESTSPSSSVLPPPIDNETNFPPSSAFAHGRMKDKRSSNSSRTDVSASSNIVAAKRVHIFTDHQHTMKRLPSSQNFSHFKNLYRKKSVDEEGCRPLSLTPRNTEKRRTQNSTEESNRSFEALASNRDADFESMQVTPDDVVKTIGEKRFWEARKAIVNQQRVFSNQVFELHKLVMVQKMIAGCPNILMQENLYGETTASPKNDPSKDAVAEKECFKDNEGEGVRNEVARKEGDMRGSSTWRISPAGSQLLVPVISPSEGLVYKPYSSAYPCAESLPLVPIMGTVPMQIRLSEGNAFTARSSSVLSTQTSRVGEIQKLESGESCFRALNLFPMSSDNPKRVIKVIPHNPTSASESVARIFQSIRKDRKHS